MLRHLIEHIGKLFQCLLSFITREAAWYINCACVYLFVCLTITSESLDAGKSYSHIWYIWREYGLISSMKVIGSRSRSREQKWSKISIAAR